MEAKQRLETGQERSFRGLYKYEEAYDVVWRLASEVFGRVSGTLMYLHSISYLLDANLSLIEE